MKKLECHVNLPIMWSIALWHTTAVSYKGYEKWFWVFLMSQMYVLQECQPWGLQVVGVYNVVNKHAFSSHQYDVSQLCCYEWSFLPALVHKFENQLSFLFKEGTNEFKDCIDALEGYMKRYPQFFSAKLICFWHRFFLCILKFSFMFVYL